MIIHPAEWKVLLGGACALLLVSTAALPDEHPEAQSAFRQGDDGLVSIESEHFDARTGNAPFEPWRVQWAESASNRRFIRSDPYWLRSELTGDGPTVAYNILFNRSGIHYVWVRSRSWHRTADAFALRLDAGAWEARYINPKDGAWYWDRGYRTVQVDAPGLHTLQLRRIERRVQIDKIVVAPWPGYAPWPGGRGPPESATVEDAADAFIRPANWPLGRSPVPRDSLIEARVSEMISAMTLEEKVGQIIQADISSVTPDEVREYDLGAVLNGGGSAPGGDNRATPDRWLDLADAFWRASTDTTDGGVGIPVIWGTDAVHGHSNVLGATIFPHNIGLGMADDPELVYRIGRATALEILVTGLDWTFAPSVAVARNDRWGRTYESYSEDPRIVADYAPRLIEGLQGMALTSAFLGDDRVIATAKHFLGDGGTRDGRDQGDTVVSEAELRDIHAAGYATAIGAGVQTVMASFNSYLGRKAHGYRQLLNDVLVERMGFDGFVLGDWNGHGQVDGCSNTSCAASFNAGLDMFMAPRSWRELHASTLSQAQSGQISSARLDEAVGRVLRVKLRAGVFGRGRPSSRPYAGDFELLANGAHRALAREAVRKSLVLLKNNGGVLPIRRDARILVAGDGAHDIGKQCGGWTLTWQGRGNRHEDFPQGTSIYEGIVEAVSGHGGRAELSENGTFDERPDVAVVVFGEDPYAEGEGDVPHVDFGPTHALDVLADLRREGIPTVSIFLSGRPMWVNPEVNASEAFVAAWLPGTEGGGIADVLVGDEAGEPRVDFTGRLSFSWPRQVNQVELNIGDQDYDPLFGYGYGLHYGDHVTVPLLSEATGIEAVPTATGAESLDR